LKPELPYIVFEATSDCNLDCRFCYNVWKRPGERCLSRGSYRQAIRALKRLFAVAEVRHVTMSGGEPFLCERFAEIVLFCRMKHKAVTVVSNGNAAIRADYEELLSLGVELFEFPLHSHDARTHDLLTGVEGSWRKALRSIADVRSLGGEVVVVCVITKHNVAEIGDTLRLLHSLGIRRIMLNRYNIGGAGIRDGAGLIVGRKALREAFREADELAGSLGLDVTSNVCTPFCILNPERYPNIRMSACSPHSMVRPLTLDTAGNVRFCNHSPVIMGNIFAQPLESILTSEYLEQWRNLVPDHCIDCDLYRRCYGGCRAAAEQVGLSLRHADPVLYGAHH
jgi:radical SAM protein with 4Fe4S-binding SPASM domain